MSEQFDKGLDILAMKCALDMEIEAAFSTTTRSKGNTILRYFREVVADSRTDHPPGVEASDEDVAAVLSEGIGTDGFDNFKPDIAAFRAALLSRGLELRKVGA